jgi:hypothetical protein
VDGNVNVVALFALLSLNPESPLHTGGFLSMTYDPFTSDHRWHLDCLIPHGSDTLVAAAT